MKLVGVAVIGSEEDVVETFVRHNLHYLDRLYLLVDDPRDGTLRILHGLMEEGLPVFPATAAGATDPLGLMLRHAAATEGAGLYLPFTPDDLVLPPEGTSPEDLRRSLEDIAAAPGDAVFDVPRLAIAPLPAEGAAYGADPLRRFQAMESRDGAKPSGLRRPLIRLSGPAGAGRISFKGTERILVADHGLAKGGAAPLALAYLPVRSVPQVTARTLGALTHHLGRGGTPAGFQGPEAKVLTLLQSGDLGNDRLLDAANAFAPTLGDGSALTRRELAPLFHYQRRYDDRLAGPMGALGGQIAAAIQSARQTGGSERAQLEARLRVQPNEPDMERYFALIEEIGATDVPADLIALSGRMSNPTRMPVGMLNDGRVLLPYLEMDISYACNLRCDGCSHYSNYAMSGVVRLADARAWLETWIRRLHPVRFRMLGGEPAINPDAAHIIRMAAEILPQTQRSMVSNGLLLHKRDDILEALAATSTALDLSLHDRDPETRAELNRVRDKAMGMGIGCTIIEAQPDEFTHLYRGSGKDIMPYEDNRPFSAWACCEEKNCACIHEGLLWKCPPLAFLGKLDAKIGLAPQWGRYLAHRGLTPDTPAERLFAYLAYPEKDCDMCPARRA